MDENNRNREQMLVWLYDNRNISWVEVFEDSFICVERIEQFPPDVCFIRLGSNTIYGLKTARMIHIINPEIRIVFVSDERDYAMDAYEIGAYGYLLSPVSRDKLESCLVPLNRVDSS